MEKSKEIIFRRAMTILRGINLCNRSITDSEDNVIKSLYNDFRDFALFPALKVIYQENHDEFYMTINSFMFENELTSFFDYYADDPLFAEAFYIIDEERRNQYIADWEAADSVFEKAQEKVAKKQS